MKKIYFSLSAIVLLVLALGILWILYTINAPNTPVEPGAIFPTGDNDSRHARVNVQLTDGGTTSTLDFINNGTTFEDAANPGNYYLAGTSEYCQPDGSCPTAGPSENFTILYYGGDSSFIIGIMTEPLGQVREEAEQYLKEILGITNEEMCKLNYTIGSSAYVNQTYGGENLGFSFCPDAVLLP